MAIFMQALSWTLIYALLQGCLIYGSSRILLQVVPSGYSRLRYNISLLSLTVLLSWFGFTFYHQLQLSHQLTEQAGAAFSEDQLRSGIYILGYSNIKMVSASPSRFSSLPFLFPWLSGLYIAGLIFMLGRLLAGINHVLLFKHKATVPPQPFLQQLLQTASAKLAIRKHTRLFISAHISVPMLIGFFKPVILLPAALLTQLNTDQLESILLHELAHIKRNDYLVNILQSIAETILFFNPFAWLIAANIRREREHCCDDLVLQSNTTALTYASALAAIAGRQTVYSNVVVAASGRPNILFHRIQRIMEQKKSPFGHSRVVAALLLIVIMGAGSTLLSPVFARVKKVAPQARITKTVMQKPEKHQLNKETVMVRKTVIKKSTATITTKTKAEDNHEEEDKLIKALSRDGLVDEAKGFTIEKQQQKLYINGAEQSEAIAQKYLPSINKEILRVEVYPFQERLKRHPGSNLMQVMFPVQQQSGCSDYSTPTPKS